MSQQLQAEIDALNRIIVHQASQLLAKDQTIQQLSANAMAKINEMGAESKAIRDELGAVKQALAEAQEPKTGGSTITEAQALADLHGFARPEPHVTAAEFAAEHGIAANEVPEAVPA